MLFKKTKRNSKKVKKSQREAVLGYVWLWSHILLQENESEDQFTIKTIIFRDKSLIIWGYTKSNGAIKVIKTDRIQNNKNI